MTDDKLLELQRDLGHTFAAPELLALALTHRSFVEEQHPGGRAPAHLSQQRLEFLGDALLNYVVGGWLYAALPEASEGDLTRRRSEFTKGAWLSARGAELGLDALVRRGRGEAAMADANRKLLEDTTEALIGAILLDGGEGAAIRVIRSWLPAEIPAPPPPDPIVALGEWHQKQHRRPCEEPDYDHSGPDHERSWVATLEIDGVSAEGRGRSKQDAKRDVSAKLLAALVARS